MGQDVIPNLAPILDGVTATGGGRTQAFRYISHGRHWDDRRWQALAGNDSVLTLRNISNPTRDADIGGGARQSRQFVDAMFWWQDGSDLVGYIDVAALYAVAQVANDFGLTAASAPFLISHVATNPFTLVAPPATRESSWSIVAAGDGVTATVTIERYTGPDATYYGRESTPPTTAQDNAMDTFRKALLDAVRARINPYEKLMGSHYWLGIRNVLYPDDLIAENGLKCGLIVTVECPADDVYGA